MTKKITLDPALISDPADELKPVDAVVSVGGVRKTISVLASESFDAGGLAGDLCFGYVLDPIGDNPAQIRICAGEIHHGARAIIDVAQTDIVITQDHQYVWVAYPLGSGAATIAGPSTSRPVSTGADGVIREWLYLFRLVAGVASHERTGHVGNIIIPGAFG